MRNCSDIENRPSFGGFDLDALMDDLAGRVASRIQINSPARIGPRLVTVDAAAEYIGRTRAAVDHMVRERKLPSVRSDRKIFLDVQDLDRWIEENKVKPDGI